MRLRWDSNRFNSKLSVRIRKEETMLHRTYIRKQARKKRRIKAAVKLLLIIAVIAAAVLLSGGIRKPRIIGYEYDTASTLWELSKRYCPSSMDKRKYIDEITLIGHMCLPPIVIGTSCDAMCFMCGLGFNCF